MKSQAGEENKKRVFLAFTVPEKTGACLLSALNPSLSVTPYTKSNLHLTVKFIGDVDDEELSKIIRIASDAASKTPPLSLALERFSGVEERLRVLVGAHAGLARLFNTITDAIEEQNIGVAQPRHYTPHITMGRLTGTVDPDAISVPPQCKTFTAAACELYKSDPGEDQMGVYTLIRSFPLSGNNDGADAYRTIVLPTRTQPDTLVAIFILKRFGESRFPGIKEALVDFWQVVPAGETEESLDKKGVILIDLGGGKFDHHGRKPQTTASDLISEYLGAKEDPSLTKLLEYARRDDFFGKGTVSDDPIDRAFGLSALVAALNKSLVKNPGKVIEVITPLLIAHHNEEVKRVKELPEEFEKKMKEGAVETGIVKQRDKKLKVVMVLSESGSMAGYLRSRNGGAYDVVAQWLPSGHVNILTRPTKRVDLRSLAALIRMKEAEKAGFSLDMDVRTLASFGRLNEIPAWYYDPATNSIQNGGLNPKEVAATKISREELGQLLDLGLSEKLWDPRG